MKEVIVRKFVASLVAHAARVYEIVRGKSRRQPDDHRHVRLVARGNRIWQAVQVQAGNKLWLHAFPQHGPGRKHERKIALECWQQEIVERHPDEFVRGLIHSDGCRTVNRFKTKLPSGRVAEYAYARYFFSNLSEDIRGLFCAACDALDVRWTLSNPRDVSVAHRASVARLDAIGCAKE